MDTRNRLAERYLKDLKRLAAGLPAEQRKELVAQIRDHISRGLAEPGADHSDAGVRQLLDRLGSPEEIVAEAAGHQDWGPIRISTTRELVAGLLMTIGSVLLPLIGWLIGVLLVWNSRLLSTRDKVLGTLILPGGAGGVLGLVLFSAGTCSTLSTTDGSGHTVVVQDTCGHPAAWLSLLEQGLFGLAVLAALVMPLYLVWRARQAANAQEALRASV